MAKFRLWAKRQHIIAVCVLFLAALLPPLTAPSPVSAANAFIDPNADGTVGAWATTGASRYTEIDDATRQPTAPSTVDNVSNVVNSATGLFLRMSSITNVQSATSITVWVYHNDGTNGITSVQLYDDNETTTRSVSTAMPYRAANTWDSVTFGSLALTQAQLDTLTVRITTVKSGGGANGTVRVHALYADVTYTLNPAYTQSAFRLFSNTNTANVGTALAAQDTAAILGSTGAAFRLRMLVHVATTGIGISGQQFKLQYVGKGTGTCASPTGGTPAAYTDVTAATLIAYSDNAAVADAATLTANANDPTHSTDTIRSQSYEELNNFTNSVAAIAAGEDGKWDFSLKDNGAPGTTAYCLRIVKSDGTALDTYSVYPQVTTNGSLGVDIVNAGGTTVASPSYAMSATAFSFDCQTSTATIGSASQKIRITNTTANPQWSLSMAATSGATALWTKAPDTYDFNDGSGTTAGCGDGGDADTRPGQLTLDASVGTNSPQSGCATTGISLGSSSAFSQGTTDSITLVSASSGAGVGCYWDITGISASQRIPAEQTPGSGYFVNFTLTITSL